MDENHKKLQGLFIWKSPVNGVMIRFLTFFFCKMTKIINFLTNMLVKKKKMCYNISKLREKEQGTIMWALGFVPLMIIFYLDHTKKVKKLENKIKKFNIFVILQKKKVRNKILTSLSIIKILVFQRFLRSFG